MQKRLFKYSLLVSCSIITLSAINALAYDTAQPSVEIDFDALTKFKPVPAPVAVPVPNITSEPIAEPKHQKKKVATRHTSTAKTPKWSETPLSMQDKLAEQEATSGAEPSTQPHKPQKRKAAAKKKPAPAIAKTPPAIVVTPVITPHAQPVKPIEAENIPAPAPMVETPVRPQTPAAVQGSIINPPAPAPMAPAAAPTQIMAPPAAQPAPSADITPNAPAPAVEPAPSAAAPAPEAIVSSPVVTPPEQPKPEAAPSATQGFVDKIKNFFSGNKPASGEDKSASAPPAPMPAPGDIQPPQGIAAPTPPVAVADANPVVPANPVPTAPAPEAAAPAMEANLAPAPAAVPQPTAAPANNNEPPKGLLTQLQYQQNATDVPNQSALDQLASQMQSDSGQRITIASYATTNDGQSSTARRISLKRALIVRKYLIDKGVDGSRINVQAMGDASDGQTQDRIDISRTGS